MSALTAPFHLLWKSLVIPAKILFSTADLTFRAGVKVGGLSVRGGAVVTRALGWKLLGTLIFGVVIGVLVGRKIALLGHNHDHHNDHDHDHDHSDLEEVAA